MLHNKVHVIGPSLGTGKYKWGGGCRGADGCIYGIPSDTNKVLRIDPRDDSVTTFGDVPEDKNKWQGAIAAPNGMIYGIFFFSVLCAVEQTVFLCAQSAFVPLGRTNVLLPPPPKEFRATRTVS